MRPTFDGGYILSGSSLNFQNTPLDPTFNFDVLLIKVTGAGELVWAKRYDALFNEEGNDIEQTPDGGYLVTGVALRDSSTQIDNILLMKTDESGNVQWANAYGGTAQTPGRSVRQLSDGGYIVAGWTNSNGDCNMLKVDGAGAVQWDKTYGGPNNDLCYSAEPTSDGGYLLAGATGSFGAGSFDGYLVKTDSTGNLQWSRAYGGSGVEFGTVGLETSDGGYVLSGLTTSFSAGGDLYLVKTDASGHSGCHDSPAATAVGVFSPRVTPLTFMVTAGGIATADAATQVANGPTATMENTLCASLPWPRVTSRKSHGSAGPFDIELPLTDPPGIECRSAGENESHQVTFIFAGAVTFTGASVTPATGKTAELDGPPLSSADGKEVTVKLKNVSDVQTIRVTLFGVSDGTNTDDVAVRMMLLAGDTNEDARVNVGDTNQTKSNSGSVASADNFRTDVNLDGRINVGDNNFVKAHGGSAPARLPSDRFQTRKPRS